MPPAEREAEMEMSAIHQVNVDLNTYPLDRICASSVPPARLFFALHSMRLERFHYSCFPASGCVETREKLSITRPFPFQGLSMCSAV